MEKSSAPASSDNNGPVDDEAGRPHFAGSTQRERERQERIRFMRSVVPARKRHPWLGFLGWIFGLLAVAGIGSWYLLRPQPKPAAKPVPPPKVQNAITTATKRYDSKNFNLSFAYPRDWTVKDPGDGELMVTSPAINLISNENKRQPGRIALTIQNPGGNLPEFNQGDATAVLASEEVKYLQPSPNQRTSSNLSFLTFADKSGLSGIYVTGYRSYQPNQVVPQDDIALADPLIKFTFTACANDACSGSGSQLNLSPNVWQNNSFAAPLKQLVASLIVR